MWKPDKRIDTDVLVIGAGFAGVTAAIHAAHTGVQVMLTSAGPTFSGSSFFPGTWGFGLIAPENSADMDDLKATVLRVGMGMADEPLVDTLVAGIHKGIREMEGYGLALRRPENKGEKEFIPCFDYKNRDWYGLVQADAKAVLKNELDRYGVRQHARTEIVSLQKQDGRICGAVAATPEGLVQIRCKSAVIATGGLSGLYKYAFGSRDCCGTGQYLALNAGAELVNAEFHQMMPGFIRPCRQTIFNEKVFRYTSFFDADTGRNLFADLPDDTCRSLFEIRSAHGPFTSRLESKEIDLRIFRRFMQKEDGVLLRYDAQMMKNPPEFVKVYFDWLKAEKGLTEADEVRLGIFYHAANGGIRINQDAFTGVDGLYACGEATGGMHGADRLGGLSTANALVFGAIAGKNAAECAKRAGYHTETVRELALQLFEQPQEYLNALREQNFAAQMLYREEKQIDTALNLTQVLKNGLKHSEYDFTNQTQKDGESVIASCRLTAGIALSEGILKAIRLRQESRGSHYRIDYPQTKKEYEQQILLRQNPKGEICAAWKMPHKNEVNI